jgi:hypothetical protein
MKSKVFVGTLLAAVVLTAGVAEAQAPSLNTANLKKNTVRVFNVTTSATAIVSLETFFSQGNIDADIVIIDETNTRLAAGAPEDEEGVIGIFNSTVKAYEAGSFSVVGATTVVIYVVHESGPGSKLTMVSSTKGGSDIANGAARTAPSYRITDGGDFDLYGSVDAKYADVQETLQRIIEAKRR